MWGWWLVGGVLLGMVGLYLLWVWLEARSEVRNAPRKDMFTCDKHGIFPAKYALKTELLPLGEATENYKVCPMCLEDAERTARLRLGLKV
jgi:hypothetical protein